MTAQQFTRQYVGLTVFGNEMESMDVADWRIDAHYEHRLGTMLGDDYGLQVVPAAYSTVDFGHVNDLKGPWNAPAFWGPNWEKIEPATLKYCADNSLDAVLVLAKTKHTDFLFGTNQDIDGAGVYGRGPVAKQAFLHLMSKLALLDCKTAKPLAVRYLSDVQSGLPGTILHAAPTQPFDFEESRLPWAQWSEEQKQAVRARLTNLPDHAFAVTLLSILPVRSGAARSGLQGNPPGP